MNLDGYVESVRAGVTDAAALADDHTRDVAERLGGAIDSATRLALIRALSDAAGSISADLAPVAVELRMAGAEPEFVVQVPAPGSEPTLLLPEPPAGGPVEDEPDLGEEAVARISLRLPASVKSRVDEMADRDGISTNAWLLRAIMDALGDRSRPGAPTPPEPPAAPIFGINGPFGPHGVFGPNGPFGASGLFGGERERDAPRSRSGNVQGWVR